MTAQLTDEQIDAAARQAGATAYTNRFVNGSAFSFGPESLREFVSAIIAANRELQAARHSEELAAYELTVANLRAQGDPVGAVLVNSDDEGVMFYSNDMIPDMDTIKSCFRLVRVYTHPAHTEAEVQEILDAARAYRIGPSSIKSIVRRILGVPAPEDK